jgi:DNA repair protein SbcC/Rad50
VRPLKLTVRAFGAYPVEQILDFRLLGERTLFLIHGATGSGKTTILDAICFALYGVCSTDDRDPKRVRSDHADPSLLTEVIFDFRIGADEYRVYRRPEQHRPKKRGGGVTKTPPEAWLSRRTGIRNEHGDGTILADKWKEVTEAVERLLGFRDDQFRQVVVLPQGKFRDLLVAKSTDRQAILEVLFQTELYRRIEEALKQAAKVLESRIKEAQGNIRFVLEQAQAQSVEELAARMLAASERSSELQQSLNLLEELEKKTQDKLNHGGIILEKLREFEKAERALASLEQQTNLYAGKRSALDKARKAAAILAEEKALTLRVKEAEETDIKLKIAREAAVQARKTLEEAVEKSNRERERQPELERGRNDLIHLESLTDRVKELAEARRKLNVADQDVARTEADVAKARQELDDCLAAGEKNRQISEEVAGIAGQLEVLRLNSQQAEKAFQQRKKLAEVSIEASGLESQLNEAADRAQQTRQELDRALSELNSLELRWIEGQAAILAQRLVPGSPCPVCGSTEHPAAARSAASLPDATSLKKKRKDVERLRTAVESAGQETSDLEKRLSEFRARAAELIEALGDSKDKQPEELEKDCRRLAKELKQAEAAEERLSVLRRESAKLELARSECRERLDHAEKALTDAVTSRRGAGAEFEAKLAGIPENVREISALEHAQRQAHEKINQLTEAWEKAHEEYVRTTKESSRCGAALVAAEDAAAEAGQRVLVQREEFQAVLREHGFADEQEFNAGKLGKNEMARLESEIQKFDDALSAARDRVQRATASAEGLEAPDMESLEVAAVKAKQDLKIAVQASESLRNSIRQMEQLLGRYGNLSGELTKLEERFSIVGRISRVAGGENSDRINFQRFVLAALLDDVLQTASNRLRIMSNSRYTLHRVTGVDDRRLAGGLDLEVQDMYTGTSRPVATLSGGESFLASLSLALGLADVVQTYAGGIHLDTIFVDEGFGSLDPEALDLAFRALVDLQRNGRIVGIISHVPDLKERIDARLEVTSNQRGSKARFVVG